MPTTPRIRAPLACDQCQTTLPGAVFNTVGPVECPGCQSLLAAEVFPAFFRPLAAGAAAENVLSDEDASCFYHPSKKAVVPCAQCGRFLCALCDIDLGNGRHLCPGCVEVARQLPAAKQDAATVAIAVPRQVLYDHLALTLAVMPLTVVLWWTSFVATPAALFLSIYYWNEPKRAVLPRGRGRLIAAMLISLLTLVGWAVFGFFFFNRHAANGL